MSTIGIYWSLFFLSQTHMQTHFIILSKLSPELETPTKLERSDVTWVKIHWHLLIIIIKTFSQIL